MSWSMREPEEPPVCECKYDQAHDRMDREDCHFHCDLVDLPEQELHSIHARKPPSPTASLQEDAA